MITEADVRAYIADKNVVDNDGLPLNFSTEEIQDAMKRCAREFNSITPLISYFKGDNLPDQTNTFLDGIAAQLYITEYSRLTKSDLQYDAGGLIVGLQAKRIAHLKDLIKFHDERFRSTATDLKKTWNRRQAWSHVY